MSGTGELQGGVRRRPGGWAVWGVLALAVLVGGAALYRMARAPGEGELSAQGASKSGSRQIGVQNLPGTLAPEARPAEGTTGASSSAPRDAAGGPLGEPIYDLWRSAILNKNAPQVLSAERSFLGDPARYHEGLAELALKDPEDRVRSFSTRELGKFALTRDVDLFTRLLENDSSPWVRQNAAWALGEIRAASAAQALGRISKEDPDRDVRAAATLALTQIR